MKKEGPSPYGLNQLAIQLLQTSKLCFYSCTSFSHNLERLIFLQFNLDEDLGYSPISPEVIDMSSESGEEFTVEPGKTAQLNEKFRIYTMGSNIMTAFVGSAMASLFPTSNNAGQQETIDTAGTRIERKIMKLIEENLFPSPASTLSFIDSEFEEVGMPPETPDAEPNVHVKSYGRPIAAILPTPRTSLHQQNGTRPVNKMEQNGTTKWNKMVRPVPTYPPNFVRESSNFHQNHMVDANAQRATELPTYQPDSVFSQTSFTPEDLPYPITSDITPMVIHLPPRNMGKAPVNFNGQFQQVAQFGFPFNTLHSTNVLLMPVNKRQNFPLFPLSSRIGDIRRLPRCYCLQRRDGERSRGQVQSIHRWI